MTEQTTDQSLSLIWAVMHGLIIDEQ